ncbi:uncharacterized protein METZ01_LOCUS94509 [marine metagenome]|uniref:Uncharacterized protein n=1 Tax=marine metagenome TaxID=408172 RepID=A0A381VMT9_9ZZZZ
MNQVSPMGFRDQLQQPSRRELPVFQSHWEEGIVRQVIWFHLYQDESIRGHQRPILVYLYFS